MRLHYFDLDAADPADITLTMCTRQGYVPRTCLLAGVIVWQEMQQGKDPCAGCQGPRDKCHGRTPNGGYPLVGED